MDHSSDDTESSSNPSSGGPPLRQLGPFRVESLISTGGMGAVYQAFDESMKRRVALKILHPSVAVSTGTQQRFAREAWIAGRLEHPAIVKVFSRGEENGISYLAMELVEGGSLAAEIDAARAASSPASGQSVTADNRYIHATVARFADLVDGLAYVHEKGFIHRDIKPQNILVSDSDGRLRLTDFGIAHAADMTQMTRPGDFIGTVRYMSPEQLAAHRASVDHRTDIYSLGVTLYEALTLTLPYSGNTEEQYIAAILGGRATPIRQRNARVSRDLETVIQTAMHPDPDRRYQSAAEFADDLRRVLENRPILARRESVAARAAKLVVRHPKTVVGLGLVVVLSVAAYLIVGDIQKSARTRELLLQTLKTSHETKKPPAEIFDGWPELLPALVRTVTENPDDSITHWFFRIHGGSRPIITVLPEDSENVLYVGAGDIARAEERTIDDSPPFLTLCDISVAIDSQPPIPLFHYFEHYTVLTPGGGFAFRMSIDSLLTHQPGYHTLHINLVSEHYGHADLYSRALREQSHRRKGDSTAIFVTAENDTFYAESKGAGSAWAAGYREFLIVSPDNGKPITPILVDTMTLSTPVYSAAR